MNMPTVTTTDIQRNFSKLLDSLIEPVVVVRDSKPEAVVIPYEDYKEFVNQRRKTLSDKVRKVLAAVHKHTAEVPESELEQDIKEAFREAGRD